MDWKVCQRFEPPCSSISGGPVAGPSAVFIVVVPVLNVCSLICILVFHISSVFRLRYKFPARKKSTRSGRSCGWLDFPGGGLPAKINVGYWIALVAGDCFNKISDRC